MWLNLPFTILIKALACFQGFVLYAYYFGKYAMSDMIFHWYIGLLNESDRRNILKYGEKDILLIAALNVIIIIVMMMIQIHQVVS